MKAKIIFLLGFVLIALKGFSQKENTFQSWLDYKHLYKLDGNWIYFGDYGFRWSDVSGTGYWRLHARPSVEYRSSAIHLIRGGLGLFYQNNSATYNTFEVRPWQGYRLNWPTLNRFRFYHYFRLEQRFNTPLGTDEDFSFTFKIRYKLGVEIPLSSTSIQVGTWYARLGFELFADAVFVNSEVTSDRNRFEAGLGYRWKKDLRVRLLYTLQSSVNNIEDVKQNDHIIRLSVVHYFGFD